MRSQRVQYPPHDRRGEVGARGVVDKDMRRRVAGERLQAVADARLPVRPAEDRGQQVEAGGRRAVLLAIVRVNDAQDRHEGTERHRGGGQHRPVPEGQVLLRRRAAEARAPAGCNDEGDTVAHGGRAYSRTGKAAQRAGCCNP